MNDLVEARDAQIQAFADEYVNGARPGDAAASARASGIPVMTATTARLVARRPELQAGIAQANIEKLLGRAWTLALNRAVAILEDNGATPQAHVRAMEFVRQAREQELARLAPITDAKPDARPLPEKIRALADALREQGVGIAPNSGRNVTVKDSE